MDTVSMLNKMSFYCQPILPLVYDESMSYYETLCKVVGQLNTTGETVNKLNEGLTGEIADRQAADAALDARIKELEKTNQKIHFIKVDTLGHLLTADVTRENLSQWIRDGDLIVMLYAPDELENSWAVATNYRCLGAAGADTMQLSFYVPISVTNNAGKSGMDVAQEVVVISLPVGALTNQWTVRSVTSTIPNTNADGFVNLAATVGDAAAVTCDVEPGAIVEALRNYFSGTNQYAVAVNARLTYDGKQYHSASAIVNADASGSGNIRIEFENYYNGVRTENGVRQMNAETIFLVGDVSTNVWSVETIDHKTFDFPRYEGFQFTRGADNVITANDESTPNAVYAQYHSDTSGKMYQNLPVRLIDTVDNAEYWNGVFDIKDGNHMTFTFVTSNYVTASGKMLVRVIELSADANTTTWKYAEKEFELPLNVSDGVVTYTASNVGEGEYKAAAHKTEYQVDFAEGVPAIIASIEAGKRVILKVNLKDPDSSESYPIYFSSGYTRVDPFTNSAHYIFTGTLGDDQFTLELNSLLTHATFTTYGYILPEPNPDGSDNGKVPTVNGKKWELKEPSAGATVDTALSDTSTNPVQNKAVKAALDGKASTAVATTSTNGLMSAGDKTKLDGVADGATRVIVDNAMSATSANPVQNKVVKKYVDDRNDSPQFKGYVTLTPANEAIGLGVGLSPSRDGNNYALDISDVNADEPTLLTGVKTPTDANTNAAATVEYVNAKVASVGSNDFVVNGTLTRDMTLTLDKTFAQIREAINVGKHPIIVLNGQNYIPLAVSGEEYIMFSMAVGDDKDSYIIAIYVYPSHQPQTFNARLLTINDDGALPQFPMASDPTEPMQIATKQYVDNHLSGAPITIKLGTGNAATSTATFAEIKAALEAGKAPILDSAPGTNHWFALNWMIAGSDSLTIQYGTFNVEGGGMANFTLYDVSVSSTGITYSSRQFTTE